jgi:hypothetical protein
MGKKYIIVLKIQKGEYNQFLDVVRSLPTVPFFLHTSSPHILKPTIYFDKAKLKANIGPNTPNSSLD